MSMRCLSRAGLLSAALLASSAMAQEISDTVDLPGVLALVRNLSPVLEIERQGVAQALAERITASVRPNPSITYGRFSQGGGQPTIFEGRSQHQAAVALPLLVAGQRAARMERAELAVQAARARVAAGESSLAAEAGAAFVALLGAQEASALLDRAVKDASRLREIVSGREASGVASRYEVTRVDVEMGGLRARADQARAEAAVHSGTLAALLALPSWRPAASGSLESVLELGRRSGLSATPDAAPAVIAAEREAATARQGVEVARRERVPVPAVSLGRSWSAEPFGAANFVGLSIEIPLLDDRRGPIARAEADARTAALRRDVARAQAAAGLESLRKVITARETALRRFESEASSQLAPLREMAEDAYRLGRGSILELIDATRSRYELEQTRLELAASLAEARLRLMALTGDLAALMPPAAAR